MAEKKEKSSTHKKQNRFNAKGVQWGARRDTEFTPYEGTYYLQEYLKRHTDYKNKLSFKELKDNDLIQDFGNEYTIRNKLTQLARATYNVSDVVKKNEELEQEEHTTLDRARIVFDDVDICLGKGRNDLSSAEQDKLFGDKTAARTHPKRISFNNVYYNHPFSYAELDNIIDSIRQNRTLTKEETDALIDKLQAELASKYYKTVKLNKFIEPVVQNKEQTRENIRIIDEAIKENKKISFNFYGYNAKQKLQQVNSRRTVLNPYYIFANGNHFYLIAGSDWKKNMSFWRIDLMGEIEKIENSKRTDVKEFPEIPNEWDESLQYRHINMSYDKPQKSRIRVKMYDYDENGMKRKLSCTFLVDAFGNNFKEIPLKKDHIDFKEDHIVVEVNCSAFGLRNWSLQYSDRVEVLPKLYEDDVDVRGQVIESLKALNEKYGNKGN